MWYVYVDAYFGVCNGNFRSKISSDRDLTKCWAFQLACFWVFQWYWIGKMKYVLNKPYTCSWRPFTFRGKTIYFHPNFFRTNYNISLWTVLFSSMTVYYQARAVDFSFGPYILHGPYFFKSCFVRITEIKQFFQSHRPLTYCM